MSDTARELDLKMSEALLTTDALLSLARLAIVTQRAINRIELLDRGIERAKASSAFIPEGLDLMQLIEDLGAEE